MTDPAQRRFPEVHPLRHDRALLDEIQDLMWMEIQKVLHHPVRARGRPDQPELTLVGGASPQDVLQEALKDLLRYAPADGINWKGLGVRIAQNKAKEALRKSRANRRQADGPDIEIASLDLVDDEGVPLVNRIADQDYTGFTEEEALREVERLEIQRTLRRLAVETLTDRDRAIVFRIQRGETREAIGNDYSLTGQRVGQIYTKALGTLRARLHDEPLFQPPTTTPTEGGHSHGD